jgi:hypothetical protein
MGDLEKMAWLAVLVYRAVLAPEVRLDSQEHEAARDPTAAQDSLEHRDLQVHLD